MSLLTSGYAACDLQIASAGPCLTDGTAGTPHVGDIYGLKVVVNCVGTPTKPFRIKWTLANVTYYYDNINITQGNGWWWLFLWYMDLDDPIPWSVTLDPDGISGDTNLANNTLSGTFTPIPPATAVDLYGTRIMTAVESYSLSFQPGSGTIPNLYVLFGVPTTHGAQNVVSVTPPAAGQTIVSPPYGVPIIEIARTNAAAATFQDTSRCTVKLSRIRVNPTLLRTNTWSAIDSMTSDWQQWLAPDQRCQSTNSVITAFVQQALPANFRTVLTPYDTARTLHRAVMKALTYRSPPSHIDAVGVLQDGFADCGGFAALLTASLRCAGIPARCISGFRQGNTVWHVRTEFHLPGVEWLVADATDGNANDPTGTFAFDFGNVPNADSFFAVDVGDAHVRPYYNFPFIQVPNYWWNGGAIYNSYTATTSLQPNGVLRLTNSTSSSLNFYLTDPPNAGTVVMQSSADLINWVSMSTNAANGNILNYSFPVANGTRRFYRTSNVP